MSLQQLALDLNRILREMQESHDKREAERLAKLPPPVVYDVKRGPVVFWG